jgi:hypothetical protein
MLGGSGALGSQSIAQCRAGTQGGEPHLAPRHRPRWAVDSAFAAFVYRALLLCFVETLFRTRFCPFSRTFVITWLLQQCLPHATRRRRDAPGARQSSPLVQPPHGWALTAPHLRSPVCLPYITLWTTKWQNALFCHTRFLFFSVVLIGKEACSTSVEWCPPLSRPGRRRCCRPPAGLRPRRAVWLAQLRIAQWRCPAQAARF